MALSAHTPRRSNRSHTAIPCARSERGSWSSTWWPPANRRARGDRITTDSADSRKIRTGSKPTVINVFVAELSTKLLVHPVAQCPRPDCTVERDIDVQRAGLEGLHLPVKRLKQIIGVL